MHNLKFSTRTRKKVIVNLPSLSLRFLARALLSDVASLGASRRGTGSGFSLVRADFLPLEVDGAGAVTPGDLEALFLGGFFAASEVSSEDSIGRENKSLV